MGGCTEKVQELQHMFVQHTRGVSLSVSGIERMNQCDEGVYLDVVLINRAAVLCALTLCLQALAALLRGSSQHTVSRALATLTHSGTCLQPATHTYTYCIKPWCIPADPLTMSCCLVGPSYKLKPCTLLCCPAVRLVLCFYPLLAAVVPGKLFHSGLPHKSINPLELLMDAVLEIQQRFYRDFPAHQQETK
jgi:hypothetical protein